MPRDFTGAICSGHPARLNRHYGETTAVSGTRTPSGSYPIFLWEKKIRTTVLRYLKNTAFLCKKAWLVPCVSTPRTLHAPLLVAVGTWWPRAGRQPPCLRYLIPNIYIYIYLKRSTTDDRIFCARATVSFHATIGLRVWYYLLSGVVKAGTYQFGVFRSSVFVFLFHLLIRKKKSIDGFPPPRRFGLCERNREYCSASPRHVRFMQKVEPRRLTSIVLCPCWGPHTATPCVDDRVLPSTIPLYPGNPGCFA